MLFRSTCNGQSANPASMYARNLSGRITVPTASAWLTNPALQKIAPQKDDISSALKETRPVFFNGDGWLDTPIYDRSKLGFGAKAQGPLVVEEPTTATVVCPGQSLSVDEYGNLIVEMEVE